MKSRSVTIVNQLGIHHLVAVIDRI